MVMSGTKKRGFFVVSVLGNQKETLDVRVFVVVIGCLLSKLATQNNLQTRMKDQKIC
jgi:hypothetical protein